MTIAEHLLSPDVTLTEHVRRCRSKLARELANQHPVYLDVNFWIGLRKAASASQRTGASPMEKLLVRLRELVHAERIFCPISDATFVELFKQSDPGTRRSTAQLIDELSRGTVIAPFDDRIRLEFEYFFHTLEGHDLPPLRSFAWLRAPYVLGLHFPPDAGLGEAQDLAIQKAFFDELWATPLTEMVDRLAGSSPSAADPFSSLAERLNHGIVQHADEIVSFQTAYRHELIGALDVCVSTAADVVLRLHRPESLHTDAAPSSKALSALHALLLKKFKENATRLTLRTIHINTCLHASKRWDKRQRFEANDFHDFHHANAGLGYCDFFFTEKALAAHVTSQQTKLDRLFDCKVASSAAEALRALEAV